MTSRRLTLIAVCLSGVTASCASTQSQFGNFIQETRAEQQGSLALDAVKQLLQLYPPAKNRLAISQTTDDGFGRAFVRALRRDGFAVAEHESGPPADDELAVTYTVDRLDALFLVRLRVISRTETVTLARAYSHDEVAVRPAGAWARQTQ